MIQDLGDYVLQPRLKAGIWVAAWLRRVQGEGAFGAVVHRGDEDAGAVLLVINTLDGKAKVLGQITGMDGARAWRALTGPDAVDERAAAELIARERGRDRDVWVIEVEDKAGRHFTDDPLID